MAVTKAKKIEQTDKLTQEIKTAKTAILTSFSGMKAEKSEELRKTVRGAGAKFPVVKNTLAERADSGTALEPVLKNLAGVTSIAYTTGDPVALAKAVAKYLEDNKEQFSVKLGVIEGKKASAKEVAQLATMPSAACGNRQR